VEKGVLKPPGPGWNFGCLNPECPSDGRHREPGEALLCGVKGKFDCHIRECPVNGNHETREAAVACMRAYGPTYEGRPVSEVPPFFGTGEPMGTASTSSSPGPVFGLGELRAALALMTSSAGAVKAYGTEAVIKEYMPEGTLLVVTPCECPDSKRAEAGHSGTHLFLLKP
jgi:hypothetical protein